MTHQKPHRNKAKSNTKHSHIHSEIHARCVGIMVSDSLSSASMENREKMDVSGKIARDIIEAHNHEFLVLDYIPDEISKIQDLISHYLNSTSPDFVVLMGGTGIAPRDVTIEAIIPMLDKNLPGFGELFRQQTYEEVGSISMVTRAVAGIKGKSVIVCLPGSPNAVKLGLKLLMQELNHILNLLNPK